jgi:thioredoxin reductase (NADPH)
MYNKAPVSAHGDKLLKSLKIQDTKTGAIDDLAVNGLFYAVGHTPNTGIFKGQLDTDDIGYMKVVPNKGVPSTYTNIPGVFACGDVVDHTYRQAITAAGSGCMAALDCERWLEAQE